MIKVSNPLRGQNSLIKGGITEEKREEEKQGDVYLPSQLERTPTTLLFMVDRVKGGRVCMHPPPSPRMG
jgi:hypothetical protein